MLRIIDRETCTLY